MSDFIIVRRKPPFLEVKKVIFERKIVQEKKVLEEKEKKRKKN